LRLQLDTNTCIEILRGRNADLLADQPRADIALSVVVCSELLTGAGHHRKRPAIPH